MDAEERRRNQRTAKMAAAFSVWLDNIPTAGHPDRGDPETAQRAADAFDALRAESENERDAPGSEGEHGEPQR